MTRLSVPWIATKSSDRGRTPSLSQAGRESYSRNELDVLFAGVFGGPFQPIDDGEDLLDGRAAVADRADRLHHRRRSMPGASPGMTRSCITLTHPRKPHLLPPVERLVEVRARTADSRLRIASMRPTGVSEVSAGQALPSVSAAFSDEVTSS